MRYGIIGAVFASLALAGCDSSDEKMARTCGTPEQAYQESKGVVMSAIKSPSAASFPGSLMDKRTGFNKIDDCTTEIISYVDFQNAYGATVRSRYSVTMKYDQRDQNWRYADLSIAQ